NEEVERRWRGLTWAAGEDWAGLRWVDRGRGYCRAGRGSRPAVSEGGDVGAGGRGGGRHARRGGPGGGGVSRSCCTCPFAGPGCKHAVAAVLAYLDALRHGREVPPADEGDPLWPALDLDEAAPAAPVADDVGRLREEIAQALTWPVPS